MTRGKHHLGDYFDVTKRCLVVEDDHFTRVTLTSALQSGEGAGQGGRAGFSLRFTRVPPAIGQQRT